MSRSKVGDEPLLRRRVQSAVAWKLQNMKVAFSSPLEISSIFASLDFCTAAAGDFFLFTPSSRKSRRQARSRRTQTRAARATARFLFIRRSVRTRASTAHDENLRFSTMRSTFSTRRRCRIARKSVFFRLHSSSTYAICSRAIRASANEHGIGLVTRRLVQGTLRDRLYNVSRRPDERRADHRAHLQAKPEETFIKKYSACSECFVIGKLDALFIASQLLEVAVAFDSIDFPYCGPRRHRPDALRDSHARFQTISIAATSRSTPRALCFATSSSRSPATAHTIGVYSFDHARERAPK